MSITFTKEIEPLWVRSLKPEDIRAYSASILPTRVGRGWEKSRWPRREQKGAVFHGTRGWGHHHWDDLEAEEGPVWSSSSSSAARLCMK